MVEPRHRLCFEILYLNLVAFQLLYLSNYVRWPSSALNGGDGDYGQRLQGAAASCG